MAHRHAVVLLCVVAVLVAPASVAQERPTPTENTTDESNSTGVGTQLTAFLQSSSAAANDSVENGMWNAQFQRSNASRQAQLVANRTGALEQRLERLQRQNESIQAAYANGSLSQPAYIARQSQLTARIEGLRAAVNDTDAAATEAGVDDSRLETLRRNASELSGPQVATVASGLGNGPPANRPTDTGPPSNETDTASPPEDAGPPGNETVVRSPANGTGPPGNQSSNAAGAAANRTTGAEESGGGASAGGQRGPP